MYNGMNIVIHPYCGRPGLLVAGLRVCVRARRGGFSMSACPFVHPHLRHALTFQA